MKPLSPRQRDILDFIVVSQRRGVTPTLREIGSSCGGITLNAVQQILKTLAKKGYLARAPRCKRRLVVLDTGRAETLWGSFEA